jgi:hypothetical protein
MSNVKPIFLSRYVQFHVGMYYTDILIYEEIALGIMVVNLLKEIAIY